MFKLLKRIAEAMEDNNKNTRHILALWERQDLRAFKREMSDLEYHKQMEDPNFIHPQDKKFITEIVRQIKESKIEL